MSPADKAFEAIAARGGDLVNPPVTIEASVPLELSGEVVRNRICTFVDAEGKEWALRPDLTLPVAQSEIAARAKGATQETIRRYRGPVFRLPALASEPVEYEQIGLERFGSMRGVEEDIWIFETLAEASVAAGVKSGAATFGDLSVFPAFVDALGLETDIAAGLKRAFRQEGGVRAYLKGTDRTEGGITSRLQGMSQQEVGAFVDDIFAMTGVQPVGERSADEIVERLYQRASASDVTLTDDQSQLLDDVLSLDAPIGEAAQTLKGMAAGAGLTVLADKLSRFEERMARLSSTEFSGLMTGARFATQFGRRFTYYDGFVFEIAPDESADGKKRPFAAGGRYDALLSDLSGGAVSATAIGGIVSPHRLFGAEGASQ